MKNYSNEYAKFLLEEHLVVKGEDAEQEREQVAMSVFDWALSEDAVMGLDLADVIDGLEGCEAIYWAKCNSKEVEDEKTLGKALIERAGVNASECSKVFLNCNGDFSLIQVNDVAESVSESVKEDADIYLAASGDWEMDEEYNVIALFVV